MSALLPIAPCRRCNACHNFVMAKRDLVPGTPAYAKIVEEEKAHKEAANAERTLDERAVERAQRDPATHGNVIQADGAKAMVMPLINPANPSIVAMPGRPAIGVHSAINFGLRRERLYLSLPNRAHGSNLSTTPVCLEMLVGARCGPSRHSRGVNRATVSHWWPVMVSRPPYFTEVAHPHGRGWRQQVKGDAHHVRHVSALWQLRVHRAAQQSRWTHSERTGRGMSSNCSCRTSVTRPRPLSCTAPSSSFLSARHA
jgi:hypothetical protein